MLLELCFINGLKAYWLADLSIRRFLVKGTCVVRRIFPFIQQHETHRQLVSHAYRGADRNRPALDAIIVPASRPTENLEHAVALAQAANCQLVVLCSRQAKASEASQLFASGSYGPAVALDLPDGYDHELFRFTSSRVAREELPQAWENPNGDLSTKRNLGLLLARILRWQRIFFMDDDIRDVAPPDLNATVAMLDHCRSAGLRVTDFPDNSVVCHAHRMTGGFQDIFVSGSALAINCRQPTGFFPEIYNEDWLFFYDDARSRRLGWSGRNAIQLHYDPFDYPQRAERQEFGDVLAEGLYALLDLGAGPEAADRVFWNHFLGARWKFLNNIIERCNRLEADFQAQLTTAVQTAMISLMQIQADVCVSYINAWRKDLHKWTEDVRLVSRGTSVESALRDLGLRPAESPSQRHASLPTTVDRWRYHWPVAVPISRAAPFVRFQDWWTARPVRAAGADSGWQRKGRTAGRASAQAGSPLELDAVDVSTKDLGQWRPAGGTSNDAANFA